MPTICCSLASLAVAGIYYAWRGWHQAQLLRDRTLRERVTYMLWVCANAH
jgi:hypothetical protein